MKFKSLLLTAACAGVALGVAAQDEASHHGFYWKPESFDLDPYVTNVSAADKSLTLWFTPEVVMPMFNEEGTALLESTVYANNATTMLVRHSTINNTEKNFYWQKVTGTALNDYADDYVVWEENGMCKVTIPNQIDYPRTDAETPNWAPAPATGCLLFHLTLGSAPARINDPGNGLSATWEDAYLSDCNGMYVGIQAPAGCTVKSFLTTSNINRANLNKDLSGTVYPSCLDDKAQTAAFDYDVVCDGNYHEYTSGEAYNALAGLKYVSLKWPNGYCTKYVDVVVYGVKPGDVVGFAGVQTLHPGWTGQEFIEGGGAGVDAIGIDNADAPVEYFNIQGMRVNNDNLTPGLYIKRQGTATSKILVK